MHMLLRGLSALGAAAATLAIQAPAWAAALPGQHPAYRVLDLGFLPGDIYSRADAISNSGLVVGQSGTSHTYLRGQAYLFRDGHMQGLGTLGGDMSVAWAVNDRGDVAGVSSNGAGQTLPFLWRDGRMINLADALRATGGRPFAVNAAGVVVGEADRGAFVHDGTNGNYLNIAGSVQSQANGINDHGVVVGGVKLAELGAYRPFIYEAGQATLLPHPLAPDGSGDFYAADVNNAGLVLVNESIGLSPKTAGAFLYDSRDASYRSIGFQNGLALDMNNQGWVVGTTYVPRPGTDQYMGIPTLYRDGQTWDIRTLVARRDAQRMQYFTAAGINDAGAIVGTGFVDGRYHAFMATPVPEPANAALLLAGLAVVGTVARRTRA